MNSIKYAKAIREVNVYLKGIRKEDLEKIPSNFLEFLNENEEKEYICNLDYTKALKDLELSDDAKGIILYIAYNYWCENENDKKEFYDKLNENEIKFQKQLSIQFGKISNNLFDENTDNAEKKNLPIENAKIDRFENKKTIFTKLLNFIKGLRKRS